MRRLLDRTLTLMVVLVTLTACGVSTQQHPETLGRQPSQSHPAEPTAPSEATRGAEGIVYLVQDTRLVAVKRTAEAAGDAVGALLRGPTASEARQGIRTAVPAGIDALDVRVHDGIATIYVPSDLTDLAGTEQILAVAQLVFTVTEASTVDSVVLMSADRQVHAPTDSGQLVSRPVTRADYRSVRPR